MYHFVRNRNLEAILPVRQEIGGRFRMRVIRPDGTVRVDTGWFKNLITNNGLDLPATNGLWCRRCYVGSGNTAPAVGDTSLVSQVAVSTDKAGPDSAGHVFTDAPTNEAGYHFFTKTYNFGPGVAEGVLAEVAVGEGPSNLFSRALILDGLGNPTTVTVLSDEILDVTYELRMYHQDLGDDVTGVIALDGEDYNYVIRPIAVSQNPFNSVETGWSFVSLFQNGNGLYEDFLNADWIRLPNFGGSGGTGDWSNLSVATYTPGSHKQVATFTANFSVGNFPNGIGTAQAYHYWCNYGVQFKLDSDPTKGVQKDNTKEFVMVFDYGWARRP